jgi:hypothetical protein
MRCYLAIILTLSVAAVGCSGLRPFAALGRNSTVSQLPSKYQLTAGQLVFRSDFVVPGGHRLVRELTAERDDICQALSMPSSDEPITVYLFPDAEAYDRCIAEHFPGIPPRRAFFMETDTELAVFAHWSDRVAEDLRHEVAHGYLHAVAPGLPLWLDEGLAEYFEVPRSRAGLNQAHLSMLLDQVKQDNWRPNLARLEQLSDISQMDQQSYAEAWAWAYFLLEANPQHREVLSAYLFDVRSRHGGTQPLSVRLKTLDGDPEKLLLDLLIGLKQP